MKNTLYFHTIALLVFAASLMLAGTRGAFAQAPALRATAVSHQQVDLAWDRLPGGPEAYEVLRKEDGPGQRFAVISGRLPGSTATYQDKTVQPSRTYLYRVNAYCDKSCGGELNEVRVTTPAAPPASPGNLEAFYISGRGMAITWQGNNSDDATFLLERSDNGGGYNLIARIPYARSLSYNDGNVSAGNRYCYRVKAVNAGGESGYSNEGCASIAVAKPKAPTGLSATVIHARQINLAWADNADNESGYDIERSDNGADFSKIGEAGANAVSFEDKGVSPKKKYWYRVVARNAGGASGYSDVAEASTPDVAPDAPLNLLATPVSNTQINLSWNDISGPFGNESGYELERSADGNRYDKIADIASDVTSYENAGLATLTHYWYRLRAKNALGYSGYSNVAEATTFDVPPAAPSGLNAMTVSSNRIDLSWKDNSSNETAFEIERSTNGTNFEKIGEVGANESRFESTGLAPATTYWFRVRAKNSINPSAYSNTANAKTRDVTPDAPRTLSAAAVSYQQVNLSWTDASGNESGFEIEISTDGSKFSKLATTAANVAGYENKGLKELTTYYYRLRAFNAIGYSGYSEIVKVTTPKAPIPEKPRGLTATPVDFDRIDLKWAALSTNATTVIIERSRKPDADFTQIGNQAANTTQYPDREILDVYDYYYRIKAVNNAGASPYSDVVKVSASAIITGSEPIPAENLIYVHDKTLYLKLKPAFGGQLSLVNAGGISVRTMQATQNMTVDLHAFSPGIYIVILEGEKGLQKQKVLIY